ncbi:MAG: membrane protein insertase YidC [Deltaproteobacteria bacterium]|nr:membrane protein insertase YidC [Candidatus Tharpella sp.]
MEKRTILAIALSLAVLLGFQYLFPTAPKNPAVAEKQVNTVVSQRSNQVVQPEVGGQVTVTDQKTSPEPVIPVEKGEIVTVNNTLYQAEIDTLGGQLKSFSLKRYRTDLDQNSPDLNLVTSDREGSYPLSGSVSIKGVWYNDKNLLFESDKTQVVDVSGTTKSLQLKAELSSGDSLIKEFVFQPESYLLEVIYSYVDGAGVTHKVDSVKLNWTHTKALEEKTRYVYSGVLGYIGEELYKPSKKEKKLSRQELMGPIAWLGFTKKYFISAIIAPDEMSISRTAGTIERLDATHLVTGLQVNQADRVKVYIGPKKGVILQSLGVHLENSIEYGWFGVIARPLVQMLHFFNQYVHNYGIAIIVLTILIKLAFYPLSQKSYKSMGKMKLVQPKLAKLKEKYKDDKARLNKEMMDLYRTNKVNPFGGCLPIVVQIPVFFALYRALMVAIELRHAPFFGWILDLSAKDPYYVTPLIMGATMFLQQKMTPSTGDAMQAKMMLFMPIIFTFMFLNFPAGLVLYWLVNNVLSIGQQYMVMRQVATS